MTWRDMDKDSRLQICIAAESNHRSIARVLTAPFGVRSIWYGQDGYVYRIVYVYHPIERRL
jgi:hypothetical protein